MTTPRLLMITVLLAAAGGLAGYGAAPFLARAHATVQLAERIAEEDSQKLTDRTLESEAFRGTGKPAAELFAEAREIERRFRIGALLFGVFCGVVIGLKLLRQAGAPREDFYYIDGEACVSCGRCFLSCPRERLRLKNMAVE